MRNNKHGKKWLRQLALAAGVALACTSQPAHAGFGTAELVSTTISQIPDCLDYRILGLSLRVIWTPYGPYYFWTLHVGHTVPAMVNQSHPYLDEMPWEDYSRLLGSAYRAASEAIVHVGFLGLADNVEIGAGRYKHHKFGKHYAPQHYESALIGHPAMIIFQKTGGGEKSGGGNGGSGSSASSPEKQKAPSNPTNSRYFQGTGNVPRNNGGNAGNGNGQQQPPPGAGFLNRWQNKGSGQGQFTDQERQSLGYDETMSQIDGADYTDYDRANDSVTSAVDGYDVSTGGRYFCTLPYTPFWPYYLSGLDSILWRHGWPLVDLHRIWNPLWPGPRIAPSTGTILPETWGHLYPRYGTVDHVDDAKASAVIARRGLDILADPQIGRVYWPTTAPSGVAWSKVYPEQVSCHKNIAHTGTKRIEERQYAWTSWFYATCDLDERGQLVLRIPLGPIQVTPAIPE
ncbi:TraU family protein [uncultured Cardiobacterium sp.]|uniref:TraU family protein n=1 Tax=uncultured Cardiobacterium sp. TaxID=417619 RepID=UPI002614646C|nr:TraU family protein [uncultured Cardiobacterium sp.]